MTTLYITKYALSSGIRSAEEIEIDGTMAIVAEPKSIGGRGYYHSNDWHPTRESAVKRAREMRLKKIASLQKQITKLEKLRFEP